VLTLIPAIEGMLLNHIGWKWGSGTRKPNYREMRQRIGAKLGISTMRARYEMHRDAALSYLDRWIFPDTDKMDAELSFLNRHYISHGMGSGNFYSAIDCHRLLTFFDVYFDFVSYECGIGMRAFIPVDDPMICERMAHYMALLIDNPRVQQINKREEQFLRQHSSYKPEEDPPSLLEILTEHEERLAEVLGVDVLKKMRGIDPAL
jgi:hypothetical protein